MDWHLKGKFYESCSCTFVCPCTWSNMGQPATNDYCRAALAFSITAGDIDGTDVSGCSMFMIIDTPPNMAEGNWTVGLIIDDSASDVTVQYTCRGNGYGRTHIRKETASLVQIESQGISGGKPFQFTAEARRTGGCG